MTKKGQAHSVLPISTLALTVSLMSMFWAEGRHGQIMGKNTSCGLQI